VTVAIIDTGIDYTHQAFGGPGTESAYDSNDPGVVEVGTFPTSKVIGGFDFAGPIYDASSNDPIVNTPSPDADPLDGAGHGTHVAATVAGEAAPNLGMAYDARLLALKVFGDKAGSSDLVSDAIEMALDPNNDLSIEDHVDVINMSLGSDFGYPDDPSSIASQNAVDNGVVVVAASGNAGDLPYVTSTPALADGVISVAASIDGGVEVLGLTVNSPGSIAGDYEATTGDFGPLTPATTGDLGIADPLDACTTLTNDLTGRVALIQRGGCSFSTKIRNAQQAGAIGTVIYNNQSGPPIGMAQDGTPDQPTIPAMMIGQTDGATIHATAQSETVNVTLDGTTRVAQPGMGDEMTDFTSRGPGYGSAFKPDVSAPGYSIEAAAAGTGDGTVLLSGTSMATPHVAGAAAQLIEKYPGLDPGAIKALLMNSARPAQPDGDVPIARQGTGVVQVDRAALDLGGYASPAGLSFGRVNPLVAGSQTETIAVTRLSGNATYDVELVPNQERPGVAWSLSSSTVTTTGGSGSVDVTLTVDPTAMAADDGFFSQSETDGWVRFTNQSDTNDTMVVGLLAVTDPASQLAATGGEDIVSVANTGLADGFADGFTLAAEGGPGSGTAAALGYRTDASQGTVEFGIALNEPWSNPSAEEIDLSIDTDGDGNDDYILAALDLGLLQGGDPSGDWITVLVDLSTSDVLLEYYAVADMNDHVAMLPVDQLGEFGFLAEGDRDFSVDMAVFDPRGLTGLIEGVDIDLSEEIASSGGPLSLEVAAGESADYSTQGEGDMLWLYSNNRVPAQYSVTSVTVSAPPPPPPPPPPPATKEFTDVPTNHIFHDEIAWLGGMGITKGCNPPTNDRFCPDAEVTRGQMAAFLDRTLKLAPTSEDPFGDDETSVFEDDINRLAAAGITKGCNPPTNDEFCPERSLSRAEMATFIVRGFGFTEGAGSDRFVDDDGNVHESAIDILGTVGVTKGCNPPTNDEFCPDRTITRGEMAAFLYRAYKAAGLGG
ncbi:MAG: S8 family serine peptidase, partial [Acidimicrobiia bacterium]